MIWSHQWNWSHRVKPKLKPTIDIKPNTSYKTIVRRLPTTASGTAVVLVATVDTRSHFHSASPPSSPWPPRLLYVRTSTLFHIELWDRRCMMFSIKILFRIKNAGNIILRSTTVVRVRVRQEYAVIFLEDNLGFDTTLLNLLNEKVEPTSL